MVYGSVVCSPLVKFLFIVSDWEKLPPLPAGLSGGLPELDRLDGSMACVGVVFELELFERA